MSQSAHWTHRLESPARQMRVKAIKHLADALPKPHSYATYLGGQFRQIRLENELAEFDFLYRLDRKKALSFKQLVCLGSLLIESCGGTIPAKPLPLDQDLLVTRNNFPFLLGWLDERLKSNAHSFLQ